MIKKLQRKFVLITMSSLFLVMVLLVGAINGINIVQTEHKIDGVLTMLSENNGKFPKFEKHNQPNLDMDIGFEMNEETQFETRYFTVRVSDSGVVEEINTGHIAAITSLQAASSADEVISSGKASGYMGIYKYKAVKQANGCYMVIFLDCRSQIQMEKFLFMISCGVASMTLLLVFTLVSVFSKRAIKPIIESMEKQKQFITDAGHEIKTPIAIISANADVLELTGGNNEWIISIRNQITRLDKLIKNLLTLSKTDEEDRKMIFSEFDLSKTVLDTAGPFKVMAETKNKNLSLEIQPGLKFHGDESSIQQLVSTLVDNAIKYSSEEGNIKITLLNTKKGIKLEVFNTTDKLDTKNLDKLFDRFYRLDSSRARATGGYGIGLSIAKSIVELHHGKISVKSEDGKSIYFTVLL